METEKQTVLVVDDATENIDVIVGLLKDNYKVKAAVNGMKALKIVESKPPDIILLDIMMPEMDGHEVITRLKANSETRDIPVIFLTGKTDVADETKGFELGAVDYISKPFNPAVVKARVDTQMELVSRRKETERLLGNILPEKVITDLKESGTSKPELFPEVTVLFSDFVDFTKISAATDPGTLIGELSDIFTAFDEIIERNACERIKTIGDAYLAVCGMPRPASDHAANMTRAAIEMVEYLRERELPAGIRWQARIGIHSGPVVGGIVGVKKYLYDIFGDTVNTASRVETAAEPMRVTLSKATRDLAGSAFEFLPLGLVELKGKGTVELFAVE
ncbi:MAG: response regulator [Victivallales bacterium]|nr:response regulator [Victivallales bacterium]